MTLHLCTLAAGPAGPDEFAACVARVRLGDQHAARELMARLQPVVSRVVRAHRVRRTPHEDLTQETFIKVFSRIDQYEGEAPITHWAARIARTTCLDHLRAQRRRPELRWADLAEHESDALAKTLAAPDPRTSEAIAKRDLIATLFARLPAADQRVLQLFVLEEKTFAEISRLTGWTTGTVKIRTFRARRKLHRLFRTLVASEQQMTARTVSRHRASRARQN